MRLSLTDYRRRRRSGGRPCFLIEHDTAGGDHYDLRLEIDGVLVSWAIPKDGRMARRTPDHPLDDAASAAVVADSGTYANVTQYEMAECLECGHLSFQLRGEKLRCCYSLTRVREGEEETWLLIRRRDGDADAQCDPAYLDAAADGSS
ncbi:DNA polymerase ligase N-terminal domain-containing protein [Mycobacterium sp. E2699]|uniref:DNA polymerase ligase N-terminal domain-containing protein n=1 Tax=Mycobacterium sp. E2699 TaxID=1834137 RepID=UPI0012E9E592|nr:DNA polymerase ligase N-terminal domain-containing protein [Mycobacterium sp. E2699]